jgi:hypothetical protein
MKKFLKFRKRSWDTPLIKKKPCDTTIHHDAFGHNITVCAKVIGGGRRSEARKIDALVSALYSAVSSSQI